MFSYSFWYFMQNGSFLYQKEEKPIAPDPDSVDVEWSAIEDIS